MSDDILSGSMIGVDAPVKTKPSISKRTEYDQSGRVSQRRPHLTPVPSSPANREQREAYVRKSQEEVLAEWRNRPLADANAEVVGRDDWGRKVELHKAGWEANVGVTPRRFVGGDVVYVMHGVMAHSLERGTVYDNLPNYLQEYNKPEDLKRWAEYIRTKGVLKFKADKEVPHDRNWIPRGFQAVVLARPEGATLTVGLCPAYEIEVIEGPLKGLRLLETPSMIVDMNGIDADGVVHPDVATKANELEAVGSM